MYESPIELITRPMIMKQVEKHDQQIYECIQQYGINVDKEELIKALQYDRDQYDKGYRDGYRDAAMKLVERLYELSEYGVINISPWQLDKITEEMVGDV